MKKRWFIVSLLTAMFALGVVGGAVLAQEAPQEPDGKASKHGVVARLAEKLGLNEGVVKTALSEVRQEIQNERMQRKVSVLVDKGILTQTQADEYIQWLESKPEFLAEGSRMRGFRGLGSHRGKFRGKKGFFGPKGFNFGDKIDRNPDSSS